MTRRTEQVASTLRRSISKVLSAGLNDPRVKGMISVTSVTLSPDLRHAKIGVSILPPESAASTMEGLVSATGYIRKAIGRSVHGRVLPQLHFHLDDSLKREAALLAEIDHAVRRSVGSSHPESSPSGDQDTGAS